MNKFNALIFIMLTGLSGCVSLPESGDAPKTFVLNAPKTFPEKISSPHSLVIALPLASPGLDSSNIAYMDGDNRLNHYAGAKWADNLPATVQALLVESFENSGGIKAVGNDLAGIKADYTLLAEIRDFQSVKSEWVQLAITAKLIRNRDRKVIDTFNIHMEEKITSGKLEEVIKTFDKAAAQAAQEITVRTLKRLTAKGDL